MRLVDLLAIVVASSLACGGALERNTDGDAGSTPARAEPATNASATDAGPAPTPAVPSGAPVDPEPPPEPLQLDASGRYMVARGPSLAWVAVDATHVYFANSYSIARRAKTGGPVQELAKVSLPSVGYALGLIPGSVVFGTPTGTARVPTSGGATSALFSGLDTAPSTIVADARGVVARTSAMIARCGTVPGCTTQPLYGSGNAFVAIDADWVYFRKQIPGSDSSLVRAPRRGPNFAAYETLVEKVDPEGLITVDESRVYFTHYVDPEMRSSNAYNLESIAKAPGEASTTVLAPLRPHIFSILTDAHWVYWTQGGHVYGLPKDGSTTDAREIATSYGATSLATDGTKLYWADPTEGAILAVPIPSAP